MTNTTKRPPLPGPTRHERTRVAAMLASDLMDRKAEARRKAALIEVRAGNLSAFDDTKIGPTPERLAMGDFHEVTIEKMEGSVRAVTTVRDMAQSRITKLHHSGILDDDMFVACKWYRDTWETAGLNPTASISSYSTTPRGDRDYGHLPKSVRGADARVMFRAVRDRMPKDVIYLFDLVVLDEYALADAMRLAKCRYSNAVAAFKRAAIELHGIVAPFIEIKQPMRNKD